MKLRAKRNLKHQGKDYRPGETFDVHNEREAKQYVDQGHAEHVDTEAGEAAAAQSKTPDDDK